MQMNDIILLVHTAAWRPARLRTRRKTIPKFHTFLKLQLLIANMLNINVMVSIGKWSASIKAYAESVFKVICSGHSLAIS